MARKSTPTHQVIPANGPTSPAKVLCASGRIWTMVGDPWPYVAKRSGRHLHLAAWATLCAHPECSQEIVLTVEWAPDLAVVRKHNNFGLVHCKKHRMTLAEYGPAAAARARAARAAKLTARKAAGYVPTPKAEIMRKLRVKWAAEGRPSEAAKQAIYRDKLRAAAGRPASPAAPTSAEAPHVDAPPVSVPMIPAYRIGLSAADFLQLQELRINNKTNKTKPQTQEDP